MSATQETKNGDGIEYSISIFGFQTFTYPSISVDAIKRRLKDKLPSPLKFNYTLETNVSMA